MEVIVGGGTPGAKQLEHDSVTPDSVRIGDGTDELTVNADGSINIVDPTNDVDRSTRASEVTLAALNTKVPAQVNARLPVEVGNFPAVQPVSDNGGSLTVDGTIAVTDGGGSLTVDGLVAISGGTITVDNQPADPATETTLDTLNSKIPASGQAVMAGSLPVVIASDQVMPLPTGAATEATLAAASAKLPAALGQTNMAGSMSVAIASNQSAVPTQPSRNVNGTQVTGNVSTVITLTAPANSVGFLLQASSANAANLRYRIGSVATTSSGNQLEPGRDTGFIPCGADISVVSESGTNEYQIQWVQQ